MTDFRVITTGLKFPEGPVAMPDGSVVLTEIGAQTITRCYPDGRKQVVANTGGGPNGAAVGPDGKLYVCNNGGLKWHVENGTHRSIGQADDYSSGSIQRVDLDSGKVETLYTQCGGHKLCGPNDIVFDAQGGFWFSDYGKTRARDMDRGGIYYARTDGSQIIEAMHPVLGPNGIGLSPDEKTLYIAETETSRLWSYPVLGPGKLGREPFPSPNGGKLVHGLGGFQRFDSLAVEAGGNVCVATLVKGGINVIAPDGRLVETVPLPDLYVTNICFGGPGLRTAFITLSFEGRLVAMDWPRPGLPLNFLNKKP